MFFLKTLKAMGQAGLLCGALVSAAFASDKCTTETWHGSYTFSSAGFILPALSTGEFGFGGGEGAVPIQGVQLITANGDGKLQGRQALNAGGQPLAATAAKPFATYFGTYKVNSDCTGTAFLTNAETVCPRDPGNCPDASFVHWALIVDPSGKKVRMVAVPPYDSGGIERVMSSVGEKFGSD